MRPFLVVVDPPVLDDLAGFVELKNETDGSVEISLFGLVKKYHGRGFGKHLLTLQANMDGNIEAVKPGVLNLAKALVEKLP